MPWSGTNKAGRLAFAERQIETLSARVGYSLLEDERLVDVVEQTRQGKKILAAKLYTDAMGSGVAEAQAAVEEIRRLLSARSPQSRPGRRS